MRFDLISVMILHYLFVLLQTVTFHETTLLDALAYCAAVLVGAAAAASTVSPLSRLYCSHTWGSLDVRLQIALVIHTR